MARQQTRVPQQHLERMVAEVLDEVQITPRLLDCVTPAIQRVLGDQLV